MKQDDVKISRATLSDMERDTATLRIVCWSFLFCNALKHRERVDWNSIGLHLDGFRTSFEVHRCFCNLRA